MPTDRPAPARRSRLRIAGITAWILSTILAAAMTDSAMAAGRTALYGADGTSFSAHAAALHHYRLRGHNLAPDGCGGG